MSLFTKKIKAEIDANGLTHEGKRAICNDGRYKSCGWCGAAEPLSINVDTKSKTKGSKWKKEMESKLRENSDEGAGPESGAYASPVTTAKRNKNSEVRYPEGIIDTKFKYCSRCNKVCYCSKKCQENDWNDHKIICNKEESNIEEISLEFDALMKQYPKASRIE